MIIGISGSATPDSSTDLLIKEALRGASSQDTSVPDPKQTRFYRLNEMKVLPCQACGKSPEPDYCFFHDDAYDLITQMVAAQSVIFGSPVYFDSVSAQAKAFIDRCNCLRPADFSNPEIQSFKRPLLTGKKGGLILVAGDYGKFDSALRTMRAFFIWIGIKIEFELTHKSRSLKPGEVAGNPEILADAYRKGQTLL